MEVSTLPSHCSGASLACPVQKAGVSLRSRHPEEMWVRRKWAWTLPSIRVWAPLSQLLLALGWMSMIRWSTKGHPLGSLCSKSSSYTSFISTKQIKLDQTCTDSKQTPLWVLSLPPSGTKRSPAGRNHRKQAARQEGSQTMWHPRFLPQEEPPPPPSVELINDTWLDYSQMAFRNWYNRVPLRLLICDRKQIFLHGQSRTGSSPHHNISLHFIYVHGASCQDFRRSETKLNKSLPLLRYEGPFFSMRAKETGWSACHAIKDAVRESRHDFMANDSRANIGVGCRGDNQVELS